MQGPAGVVISIAGWMLDPVVCAGMAIGAPRVDVAALVELQRRLKGAVKAADSRSDVAIVPQILMQAAGLSVAELEDDER
ncbi:MAG: hypothetical protein FD148_3700 [Methylocystaceae bacterium]|nr:MAG: hypothetical protein FD148_3700 [Methylocystaceae bacterium]